jgi:hypothetical protein
LRPNDIGYARDHGRELEDRLADDSAAGISTDMDTAWRQLTGAPKLQGPVTTNGPAHWPNPSFEVRGIIV